MKNFKKQFEGYGLTTVRVLYMMPDYPTIIAPELTWQTFDCAPHYPEAMKFLGFWTEGRSNGSLLSWAIFHRPLLTPNDVVIVRNPINLH